jgi:hypothetical protein
MRRSATRAATRAATRMGRGSATRATRHPLKGSGVAALVAGSAKWRKGIPPATPVTEEGGRRD